YGFGGRNRSDHGSDHHCGADTSPESAVVMIHVHVHGSVTMDVHIDAAIDVNIRIPVDVYFRVPVGADIDVAIVAGTTIAIGASNAFSEDGLAGDEATHSGSHGNRGRLILKNGFHGGLCVRSRSVFLCSLGGLVFGSGRGGFILARLLGLLWVHGNLER